MRIKNKQHFEAFKKVVDEIVLLSPKFKQLALGSLGVVGHNVQEGNLDGATLAGAAALTHLVAEHERLMKEFRIATENFLGEKPLPSETDADFFIRISSIDPMDWPAMASRNGVILIF